MDPKLEGKLVVAISSRALFDLDEAHCVFEEKGLEPYREFQIAREEDRLPPGTGFSLVRGLLSINEQAGRELVEVVLVSRNDADTGLRVMNSVEQYGLPISRAVFTDGREPYAYLEPFSCHLFLSANTSDVAGALEAGFAAGRVYQPPAGMGPVEQELRIAFDGDAVLFSPDAEDVFRKKGLDEFHRQEQAAAEVALNPGPFKGFLEQLHRIQGMFPVDGCPIRTALVTARSAPAHKRAIKTLRQWNVRVNEAFFLGGVQKDGVLARFRPHIFFDDQRSYCERASERTPTAHVALDLSDAPAPNPLEGVKRRASRASDRRRNRSKGGR